ncbi:hypothetical protein [Ktedonobacter sp. SOSP1-52]|uniref:hypothetical protein n=1 Tax=Ktedonobacter sp. SOSP1-52 TaxID=2778366 RepID=UPI001F1972FA|nr:hypothetical protein [Ktedonobacter sp. SOSP1-52]
MRSVKSWYFIWQPRQQFSQITTRTWLADHPRIQHLFLPKGVCWLDLQEGWWRLFRRDAFADQSFANAHEIERAMQVATAQLNHRAKPWIWGRPPRTRRHLHRLFCYRFEECSTNAAFLIGADIPAR